METANHFRCMNILTKHNQTGSTFQSPGGTFNAYENNFKKFHGYVIASDHYLKLGDM